MTPDDYATLSAHDIATRIRTGHASARQIIIAALDHIALHNPQINAFTTIRHAQALAEADALDQAIAAERPINAHPQWLNSPLLGVPIAVKEEYDVTGMPTTLGGWGNTTPATRDSEAIRKIRQAGAIIVGKTTMPEFGLFTDTCSQRYGTTHNPHRTTHSAGGSSGGSAAAVASGMVPIALGADGGGSIRIPSSCCGTIGLKPARGRISPSPLTHHWHALVTLGAITRTVTDTAIVNDVLAGNLPSDQFTAPPLERSHQSALNGLDTRLRIIWTHHPATPGIRTHPSVTHALRTFVDEIRALGHHTRPTQRPWPIVTSPFLTQFFAGVHEEATQVENPHALEKRTRQVAAIGRHIPTRHIHKALYQSERIGRTITQRFLHNADILILPTIPLPVCPTGTLTHKPLIPALLATAPYVANTAIFNVSGHPALSFPARVEPDQLPIGMQLVTQPGKEHLLIGLAREIEQHRQR